MARSNVMAVVLACCLMDAASAQVLYSVVDLGTLGGTGSVAYAINDAGTIVGEAAWSNGESHAFVWSNGVMTKLLDVPGGVRSDARGINSAGHIVGVYHTATDGVMNSYLWRDGAYTNLTLFPGGRTSAVWQVSDSGQVAGHSHHSYGGGYEPRAFSWTTNASVTIFPFDDDYSSEARGVNSSGLVVGFSFRWWFTYPDYYHWHPFVWWDANTNGVAEKAEMIDCGTFGGFSGEAYAINNAGQVIGKSMLPDFSTYHAFLLTPRDGHWDNDDNWQTLLNTYMEDLGTLGGTNSAAYGLNDNGFVVGASDDADDNLRAFLFDGVVMWDLNRLIDTNSGWHLSDARGINSHGAIVGQGVVSGKQSAFLLEPLATNYVRITRMQRRDDGGTSSIAVGWSAWGSNMIFNLEAAPDATGGVWGVVHVTNQWPASGRIWRDRTLSDHTQRHFRVRALAD